GYSVLALDWSPEMVRRTYQRAQSLELTDRISVQNIGVQELDRLVGQKFDVIYSNLGAINCAPDLDSLAEQCDRHLIHDGTLIFSVIGRHCPWEFMHYAARGRW